MKQLLAPTALVVLSAGIFTNGSLAAGLDPTRMVCGTSDCAPPAPASATVNAAHSAPMQHTPRRAAPKHAAKQHDAGRPRSARPGAQAQ